MAYKKTDKYINKAFDEERLFVLMARDTTAPMAICEWIKFNLATQPPDKLHEALDAAIEMRGTCVALNDKIVYEKISAMMKNKKPSKGKDEELE